MRQCQWGGTFADWVVPNFRDKREREKFARLRTGEILALASSRVSYEYRTCACIFAAISYLAQTNRFLTPFMYTYPPPTMRHLSSPAINKSLFPWSFFSSPVHGYFTGLGLRRKTKHSPVPKYAKVFRPLSLSPQLVFKKAPIIYWWI